jgi:hypothetical protein
VLTAVCLGFLSPLPANIRRTLWWSVSGGVGVPRLLSNGEAIHATLGPGLTGPSLVDPLSECGVLTGQSFLGSSAGAAHLLKNNAGVRSGAHQGQKPWVEGKAKCSAGPSASYNPVDMKLRPSDPWGTGTSPFLEVSEKLPQG